MGSVFSTNTEQNVEHQWKCKLCGMLNSTHLSYCEVCLVSENAQKNTQILEELRRKLLSNECNHNIKADDIKIIANKLCDDLKKLKQIHKDKQIAMEVQNEINHIFEKNNIQCNPNIVHDYINHYHIDDKQKKFKKQREINAKCNPICRCGAEMKRLKANQCYDAASYSYVICDTCDHKMQSKDTVFHCPKQQVPDIHPDGFDICAPCRKKYIHRLRKFAALIICPTLTEGNIVNDDPEILKNMFIKLGFHEIICLKGNKANKDSVKKALKQLSPNDKNANQLTVICYSGHGQLIDDKPDKFAFSLNGEPLSMMELLHFQCRAASSGASRDGLKLYYNEWMYNKLYRHNTLLLINSCHAQGVNRIIDSQKIADSFSKAKSLTILFSLLGADVLLMASGLQAVAHTLSRSQLQCIQDCYTGALTIEYIAGCLALTTAQFVSISVICGISFAALVVITIWWITNNKSTDCETLHAIASCHIQEESIVPYKVSPFIRYCDEFFNDFLNGNAKYKNEVHDSPNVLLMYLKKCYEKEDALLFDGSSLSELGQNVCGTKRGFKDFALCPLFKSNLN